MADAATAPSGAAAFKQKARKDRNVRKSTLSFDAEELLEQPREPQSRTQSSPATTASHDEEERKEDEQTPVRRPLSPITRPPQRVGALAGVAEQDEDDGAAMQAVADMRQRRQKRQQQQLHERSRRPVSQLSATSTSRPSRPVQSVSIIGDDDYHTADASDQQQQQDTSGGEYSAERLASLRLNAIHIGATATDARSPHPAPIELDNSDDATIDAPTAHQQRLIRAAKAQRARHRTLTPHASTDYVPVQHATSHSRSTLDDDVIRIDDDDDGGGGGEGGGGVRLGRAYLAADEDDEDAHGTLMREDDEDDVVDMTMEAREVKDQDRLLFGDDGKAKRKEKTRQEIADTLNRRGMERKEIDVEDVDSEMEEWEAEQLRKGSGVRVGERNTAPSSQQPSTSRAQSVERDTAPPATAQVSLASLSLASLQSSLQSSLSALHHTNTAAQSTLASLTTRLSTARTMLGTLSSSLDTLNDRYQFYQQERDWVAVLSGMLAEKVADVDDAWREMASLRRKHGQERQARTRQYRRDDREETGLIAKTAADVVELDEFGRDLGYVREMDRERRDGIRSAVRALLQKQPRPKPLFAGVNDIASGLDGWATEDDAYDEVEGMAAVYEKARVSLVEDVRGIMADVDDEWRSVHRVVTHFQHWQRRDQQSYNDAYVSLTLPKLLAPYFRIELMLQAPLQADDANQALFDTMTLVRVLRQLHGAGDLSVQTQLGADVVVPYMCDLIRWECDVRSSTHTVRLRDMLRSVFLVLSSGDRSAEWCSAQWQRVLTAYCERLQAEVDDWHPMSTGGAVSEQQFRAIVRDCVRGLKLLSLTDEWDESWHVHKLVGKGGVDKSAASVRLAEVKSRLRLNVAADLRVLNVQFLLRGAGGIDTAAEDFETNPSKTGDELLLFLIPILTRLSEVQNKP